MLDVRLTTTILGDTRTKATFYLSMNHTKTCGSWINRMLLSCVCNCVCVSDLTVPCTRPCTAAIHPAIHPTMHRPCTGHPSGHASGMHRGHAPVGEGEWEWEKESGSGRRRAMSNGWALLTRYSHLCVCVHATRTGTRWVFSAHTASTKPHSLAWSKAPHV